MRRLRFPQKLFLVFLSLTTMTFVVAVSVYYGFLTLYSETENILRLRALQAQVQQLAAIRPDTLEVDEDVLRALAIEVRQAALGVRPIADKLEPDLARRLNGVANGVGFYQDAWLELKDKYEQDRRFAQDALGASERFMAQIPHEMLLTIHSQINMLLGLGMRMFEQRDVSMIREMRQLSTEIGNIIGAESELYRQIQAYLQQSEMGYLNYLAILDRETFLRDTSESLLGTTEDTISAIADQSRWRGEQLMWVLLGLLACSLLLSIGLWLGSNRYFRRFLQNQRLAIEAIRRSDYDYPLPPASDDELGELTLFMKDMAMGVKTSEAFFVDTLNDLPSFIFVLDLEGNIRFANRKALQTSGLAFDAVIGTSFRQSYWVDHEAMDQRLLDDSIKRCAAGEKIHFETRWRIAGGALIWVEFNLHPIFEEGGGWVKYLIPAATDITARKRQEEEVNQYRLHLEELVEARTASAKAAEARLRESEKKYRMLFESAADAVLLTEGERLIDCNDAALQMFGCQTVDLMVQQTTLELAPTHQPTGESSAELLGRQLEGALEQGSILFEWHAKRLDDARAFSAEVRLTAMELGERPLMQWVIRDITARKQIESELRQAKETAESTALMKSEFLANMSHEIRTPMNAVIGLSHLALQTDLDDTQRNYIEKVSRSAENLLAVLNDILDFSKIESGKLDMEVTDFHLDEVLNNVAKLTGPKARKRGVELVFNIEGDVSDTLVGDPLRLGQILGNLSSNAVKFTDKGGEVVVSVNPLSEDDKGVLLHFSVQDTGIGMTRNQQARLFQPFSQGDSGMTRQYGGTGLGLAISKKLTEMMDGRIWMESEEGHGSTFHFTVRLEKSRAEKSLPLQFSSEHKVLVVDDNRSSREALSGMLTHFGCKVEMADSARDGIDMLRQADSSDPFGMVLMDWQMPGMDGVTAARVLQQAPGLLHPPAVVIVSGQARERVQEAAQGLELVAILSKPITRSLLYATLNRFDENGGWVLSSAQAAVPREDAAQSIEILRGACVLLVEDDELNQELACELLRSNGLKVEVASNGAQALDMLEHGEYDGVLMDCLMPVMDGYAASRRIREQERYRDLPILAMTANSMMGDRKKALAAGMNDHIAKPIDIAQLFNTMARWITPHDQDIETRLPEARIPSMGGGLPALAGIDQQVGLEITQGNLVLYRKLLLRFSRVWEDFPQRFQSALTESVESATRLAHTLKGNAANLGMHGVRKAAAALEACDKLDVKATQEALATTMTELDPVLAGLDAALEILQEKDEAVAPSLDIEVVGPLFRELYALVQAANVKALGVAERIIPLLQRSSYGGDLEEFLHAVEEYDFDAATEKLAALSAKLGIEL